MRNDIDRARDALYSIPSDLPRDQWVKSCMAAHAAGLSFDDFDQWSAPAGNYNAQAARATWRSFKTAPGVVEVWVRQSLNVECFQLIGQLGTARGVEVLRVIVKPLNLIPPGIFNGWVVVEFHDGRRQSANHCLLIESGVKSNIRQSNIRKYLQGLPELTIAQTVWLEYCPASPFVE